LFKVKGNSGADGRGTLENYSGNIRKDTFSVQYLVFQVSGALSPSVCEVYFVISSEASL